MLISLPLVAAVIFIVQSGGDYFFLYLWIFVTLVIVLLMTVYPDYIAPLFDKYSPLQEGELKSQIEKLAASIDFPLKKLYVVEGKCGLYFTTSQLYLIIHWCL
jgi:STE24 endopeptidase